MDEVIYLVTLNGGQPQLGYNYFSQMQQISLLISSGKTYLMDCSNQKLYTLLWKLHIEEKLGTGSNCHNLVYG